VGIDRTPTEFGSQGANVYVYTASAPGESYVFNPSLRADVVHLRMGPDAGYAQVSRFVGPDETYEQVVADLVAQSPGVKIYIGHPDQGDYTEAFEGILELPEHGWSGAVQGREWIRVTANHISSLLDHLPAVQISGSYFHSDTSDVAVLVASRPCIFNADGLADSHPGFITFGRQGTIAAQASKWWNVAAMLYYLFDFYGLWVPAFDFTSVKELLYPYTNIFNPGDLEQMEDGPAWAGQAIFVPPQPICLEGCSLLEGLRIVCDAAGLTFSFFEPSEEDPGNHRTFQLHRLGMGPEKWLRLAPEAPSPVTGNISPWLAQDAQEHLAASNVNQGRYVADQSRRLTDLSVIGSPHLFYLQMELKKLWGNQILGTIEDAAKHWYLTGEELKDDEWYQKYCTGGQQFLAGYEHVGRRWGLNEAGQYDGEATNVQGLVEETFGPGVWGPIYVSRLRRFLPNRRDYWSDETCGLAAHPYRLDVSFDEGETWATIDGGFQALPHEATIWLGMDDLSKIAPPEISEDFQEKNLAFAIINEKAKLRVWAVIEGDALLRADRSVPEGSVPAHERRGAWIVRPDLFWFSYHVGEELPGGGFSRLAEAAALADRTLAERGVEAIAASMHIPWIETLYDLGDSIAGIEGRDISFTRTLGSRKYQPQVAGIIWRFGEGEDTELVLEDYRLATEET